MNSKDAGKQQPLVLLACKYLEMLFGRWRRVDSSCITFNYRYTYSTQSETVRFVACPCGNRLLPRGGVVCANWVFVAIDSAPLRTLKTFNLMFSFGPCSYTRSTLTRTPRVIQLSSAGWRHSWPNAKRRLMALPIHGLELSVRIQRMYKTCLTQSLKYKSSAVQMRGTLTGPVSACSEGINPCA